MFNRVLVVCEFSEEDVSFKELLSFSYHPLHCHYRNWMDPYIKDVKLVPQRLEENIPLNDLYSLACAVQIFDAMIVMQQIPASVNSFGDISDCISNQVMKYPAPGIFFVIKQYNMQSIKSFEREKRAITGVIRVIASRRDQPRPKEFRIASVKSNWFSSR